MQSNVESSSETVPAHLESLVRRVQVAVSSPEHLKRVEFSEPRKYHEYSKSGPAADMSISTYQYMVKYNLVDEEDSYPPSALPIASSMDRILDCAGIKRLPKL